MGPWSSHESENMHSRIPPLTSVLSQRITPNPCVCPSRPRNSHPHHQHRRSPPRNSFSVRPRGGRIDVWVAHPGVSPIARSRLVARRQGRTWSRTRLHVSARPGSAGRAEADNSTSPSSSGYPGSDQRGHDIQAPGYVQPRPRLQRSQPHSPPGMSMRQTKERPGAVGQAGGRDQRPSG
jgi:hypothetical protein